MDDQIKIKILKSFDHGFAKTFGSLRALNRRNGPPFGPPLSKPFSQKKKI